MPRINNDQEERNSVYFWERKVNGGELTREAKLRRHAEGVTATKGLTATKQVTVQQGRLRSG